jgi:transcriptional regulator with XRE-family HTH domain
MTATGVDVERTSDAPFPESLGDLLHGAADLASVARQIGVGPRYLNSLLEGEVEPSVDAIELISDALGVPPGYFMEYRLGKVVSALQWDPERVNSLFLLSMAAEERSQVREAVFDNRPLKDLVRSLLREEELTQAELADSIGVSASDFSLIINGRIEPPPDFAYAIAQAFGLPEEVLFAYRLDVVADWLRERTTEINELWTEITRGPSLAHYVAWEVRRLPDPRDVSLTDLARSLIEIVKVEGPVLGARVYGLRLSAARIDNETRELRSLLNRASHAATHARALMGVNEGRLERTQKYLVLRAPDQPEVLVRERGPRSIPEIPRAEVARVAESTLAYRLGRSVREIQNEVLAAYGVPEPRLFELEHINRAITVKGGR